MSYRCLPILFFAFFSFSANASESGTGHFSQDSDLRTFVWMADDPDFCPDSLLGYFGVYEISDATFMRMQGRSYPKDCKVARSELRYLILPHYDGHGHVLIGEMVCNRAIADDLIAVFRQLYRQKYPIERMVLIDEYDGDDEASMADNNTSCFNYRVIAGSKKMSRHAYGMAIDISPLYNPYVRTTGGRTIVLPAVGTPYVDRSRTDIPFKITRDDPACKLLRARGFKWGGSWGNRKDYQHFQK